ncbi:oligosaccharide flippase family protein [Hephaestia sp. GCM10023244]|uniref:oligosaccharide flippase family protein n=1 Tax=unclassified Hephaestia TaxID=2631281 RepID=UPI0020770FB3|nr:oligosaccharide flippase family protein [Hephaestia sp. MAHUQ-44]MCM8731658.1 oligosaccharide flippase family protein [Hephaestia sp. MAHUQ-44]
MATTMPMPVWRRALTSGIGLVTATIVASNVLRIVSTIVLTRVLSPADFGVAGLTAVIIGILTMMSDFGFGVYVVQHPQGNDARVLDSIWTVRLLRALVLTLLLFAGAQPLAWLIGKPEMRAVIEVISLQFLIEGCSSLAPFSAVRDQRIGRLSLLDIISAVAQTLIGIALALVLRNYWAIVLGGLMGTAIRSWLSYPMFAASGRRFNFDRQSAIALWRFGRTIASAHTIQVLLSNVDKLVLSRVFPLSQFGLYTLASNLAAAPSAFTSIYPNRILLPAYAAAWRAGEAALAAAYYRDRRRIMLLYMVAMGGFIAMAPSVIALLYDPRYASTATYLRLLALAPALALNNYAAREALIVADRVRTLLFANFVRLGWLAIGGGAGFLAFGPIGLVAAVGLVELPVMLYCWYELARIGVFRLNEEMLLLAALAGGVVLGLIGNMLYFAMWG